MKNTTTSEAPDFSVIGGGEKLNKYLLDFIFPVGSYFITHNSAYATKSAVEAHFGGKWTAVSSGYFLEATTANDVGGIHEAGLPNITGYTKLSWGDNSAGGVVVPSDSYVHNGALYMTHNGTSWYSGADSDIRESTSDWHLNTINIDASKSNSIYKDGVTTVQPKSRLVYIYYRTA